MSDTPIQLALVFPGQGSQSVGMLAELSELRPSVKATFEEASDGAGIDLKPAEWLLLHLVLAVAAGLVGLLVGSGDPVVGLLFLIVGVVGPWTSLLLRRGARRRRFAEALPDTLQLMSGSLSAGLSQLSGLGADLQAKSGIWGMKVDRPAYTAAVLRGAQAQARGFRIDGVRVVGLADAAGTSADNLALSKARATAVTQALQRAGLPAAEFDVAASGDAGAVNRQGEAAPLRRRVDVMIAVSPPAR